MPPIDIRTPGVVPAVKEWLAQLPQDFGGRHPREAVLREVWMCSGNDGGYPILCINYDWHDTAIHQELQRRFQVLALKC